MFQSVRKYRRSGLDRRVPEQLLHRLQVPLGGVQEALTGGVPGLVHPLPARGALRDDAGVLEGADTTSNARLDCRRPWSDLRGT